MREARISIINTRRAALEKEENSIVLARARDRIHAVGGSRPDLILIAELFANPPAEFITRKAVMEAAQDTAGPVAEELSALAKKHRTYIAFGLLRREGDRYYNSLVLLDRDGKHVWTYDKTTPMAVEMTEGGITPGGVTESFQCDFGRIGGAICFDINYLEQAEIYSRQGIELLLFSSAFHGGRLPEMWGVRYGFAVATSTWYDDNRIIDCTGAELAHTSDRIPYATAALNLNRIIVHMDYNEQKLEQMLAKYAGDVLIDGMGGEATCVITSMKPGLEVRDLIREFDIETLPAYFDRNRRVREDHGGLRFPQWL